MVEDVPLFKDTLFLKTNHMAAASAEVICCDETTIKMRKYNMARVPGFSSIDCGMEHLLYTFSVDTENRYLKDIQGMVSKITFDNPDRREIIVKLDGHEYARTTENFVSFTLPLGKLRTPGQLVQETSSSLFDKQIDEQFPTFYGGNVRQHYLSLSAIRNIELVGLSDNTPITLDMITIMKYTSWFSGPTFSSFRYSF